MIQQIKKVNKLNLMVLLSFFFLSIQAFSQPGSQNIFKKTNEILQRQFMEGAQVKADSRNIPENNWGKPGLTLTHILEIQEKLSEIQSIAGSPDTVYLGDTLVIGFTPGDELIIDTVWFHPGPIIVLGDGLLKFTNAEATILGNLYAVGNARIIADSSYLYFPQQYFYQRIVLLTGHSRMEVRNSTLDFGGLVHNWATTDSAVLLFENVTKPDFSTVGMYGQSTITIDSVNVAGEFIIDDSVHLEIDRAKTVLLWHKFGNGAAINWSFPDGADVGSYSFDSTVSGVSGVDYDIQIVNCKEVWWGLMPSGGSDVTITDSDLRTIGLWFEGGDSSNVRGLVNNNHYDDFTAPLDDRNLHLINCDVMTWSIYTFDSVVVDITGCIIGEIGVMGNSIVNAFNSFIDGSGGYLFTTDTTFTVVGFSSLTSSLRSGGNSFLIFAYSTMMNGLVQALENSILMLIQSSTSEAPTYDPGAVVWMANIGWPGSGFASSTVQLFGSAWIDKGAASLLMDFDHYTMYYQKANDTSWFIIGNPSEIEVRDGLLVEWDTEGLEPGAYFLKLDLTDDWENTMTATRAFTLLPLVLGIEDNRTDENRIKVFPNPFSGQINFEVQAFQGQGYELRIYNGMGKKMVSTSSGASSTDVVRISVDGSNLPAGIYYYRLIVGKDAYTGKLISL